MYERYQFFGPPCICQCRLRSLGPETQLVKFIKIARPRLQYSGCQRSRWRHLCSGFLSEIWKWQMMIRNGGHVQENSTPADSCGRGTRCKIGSDWLFWKQKDRWWWLPVKQRIDYKLAVLTYKATHSGSPSYLASPSHYIDYAPSRSLRSSDKQLPSRPHTSLLSSWLTKHFLLVLQRSGMACLLTAALKLVWTVLNRNVTLNANVSPARNADHSR